MRILSLVDYAQVGFFLLLVVILINVTNNKFVYWFLVLVILSVITVRWNQIEELINEFTGTPQQRR